MKHYPIGTLVNFENVTLKVLAQVGNNPSCYGCYFHAQTIRNCTVGQYHVANFLSLARLTKDATGNMWCINFPTLNVKSVNSL